MPLIDHSAFAQDGVGEGAGGPRPFGQHAFAAGDDVHRSGEALAGGIAVAPGQGFRRGVVVEDHHQIDIAVGAGIATGLTTEQHHPPGRVDLDDGFQQGIGHGDHAGQSSRGAVLLHPAFACVMPALVVHARSPAFVTIPWKMMGGLMGYSWEWG